MTTATSAELTSAMVSAHNLLRHLQHSLHAGNAVTAIILLPLIARAAALQGDISALIDALNATE